MRFNITYRKIEFNKYSPNKHVYITTNLNVIHIMICNNNDYLYFTYNFHKVPTHK
jgi:hypothetical protein